MTARPSARMRQQVRRRAGGRCEYRRIHEDDGYVSYQIDHILARKHGGTTTLNNLAFTCVLGNRYKGSDIAAPDPETGEIVPLFHPRQQQWQEHFALRDALIIPLTSTGKATVILLRLNAPQRVLERAELLRARRHGLL